MKKLIFLIPFLLIIVLIDTKEQNVLIPEESLRFRVIANSDSEEDQALKMEITENLQDLITDISTANLTETIGVVNKKMDKFERVIDNTLKSNNSSMSYEINLGYNYFPEKNYKGVTYQEGNYQSLVITLGKGQGKNWWCVVFPPLCAAAAAEVPEAALAAGLSSGQVGLITEENQSYVLKSKLVEFWRTLEATLE